MVVPRQPRLLCWRRMTFREQLSVRTAEGFVLPKLQNFRRAFGFIRSFSVGTSRVALGVNNPPATAGDAGSIPGRGRSSGRGNGNPLQSSCLENPTARGAWWAAVHVVAKSQTRLSDFTFTFHFHSLEKEMATHSSALAWRIPGMGSLVGCCLWGRTESDTTEAMQQQQQQQPVSCTSLLLFSAVPSPSLPTRCQLFKVTTRFHDADFTTITSSPAKAKPLQFGVLG